MNKNTRRLSAAVTAAASAVVLATLLAAPANAADTYKVKAGDTLSAISASTGVPLSTLFSTNGLGWNTIIYPGQTINLGGAAAPAAPAAAPAAASGTAAPTPSRPGTRSRPSPDAPGCRCRPCSP